MDDYLGWLAAAGAVIANVGQWMMGRKARRIAGDKAGIELTEEGYDLIERLQTLLTEAQNNTLSQSIEMHQMRLTHSNLLEEVRQCKGHGEILSAQVAALTEELVKLKVSLKYAGS